MQTSTKILWESKGKTPAGDPFFTVKESRGYYVYGERGGKDSIAFILWDMHTDKYLLIHESKPPMDESNDNKQVRMTTAFGGSIDEDMSYIEICQKEVLEEAGYAVSLDDIVFMGKTLVSSQMSQMCHLYLVNVTHIEKTGLAEWEQAPTKEQIKKDPDEFIGNHTVWLSGDELLENSDWKSIFIYSKFNAVIGEVL